MEFGYDVIMASEMLGHIAPIKVDSTQKENIELLSDNTLWLACEKSIRKSLSCFMQSGIEPQVLWNE